MVTRRPLELEQLALLELDHTDLEHDTDDTDDTDDTGPPAIDPGQLTLEDDGR